MAPRELRKRPAPSRGEALVLRLGYRPPYDFAAMLRFLQGRALPGVEVVDETGYRRVVASCRGRWRARAGCVSPHGPTSRRSSSKCTASRRCNCSRWSSACGACSTWMPIRGDRFGVVGRSTLASARTATPGFALAEWVGWLRNRGPRDHRAAGERCRCAHGRLACRAHVRTPLDARWATSNICFPTPEALADADLPAWV